MQFTVVTLFPKMIESFLANGLLGQAHARGEVKVTTCDPREYTEDVHRTVDDRAFGGGDGMVMKVEPLVKAVTSLRAQGVQKVMLLTPQGRRWNQSLAREYAQAHEHVALVCGRYAGIDQRFHAFADAEISLGDFILNGGEVAACAIIESVVRLRPGVLGNPLSAASDSFSEDLLECPQFTRPREVEGMRVPAPLLSGNHMKIRAFELAVARVRTRLLRSDLMSEITDLSQDVALLAALEDSELKAVGLNRTDLAGVR